MRLVILANGFAWAFFGVLMVLPIAVNPGEAKVFGLSAFICSLLGAALMLAGWGRGHAMRVKDAFLLTTTAWISAAMAGSLPILLSGSSFTDAFFESMSGITTTGSTVLSGLDAMPRGLLLWRALLQWTGGLGVIVTAIAILPMLKIGGMQLFRAESSDKAEKELATAAGFALATSWVYLALSIACALAYAAAGMSTFDAIAHAMTTVSTGGFSTHDASMGFFTAPAIHWIAVVFMLSGSLPFVWYIRIARRGTLRSEQVASYLAGLGVIIILFTAWLMQTSGLGLEEALRHVAFNVVSVVTTSGYASTDYTLWGSFAVGVFFMLTFAGGCTGSTSGGLKTMRSVIMVKAIVIEGRQIRYPHGVFALRFEGRPVQRTTYSSVVAFVSMFGTSILLVAVMLSFAGLDVQTSLSGAATAIANVGPGIGPVIGPAGNFQSLPDAAKWILSFAMLLGRLELLTVIVLFLPSYWEA